MMRTDSLFACVNPFPVKEVRSFLAKEKTLSSLNCFNYWNNPNLTNNRNIQICDIEFTGAYESTSRTARKPTLFYRNLIRVAPSVAKRFSRTGTAAILRLLSG